MKHVMCARAWVRYSTYCTRRLSSGIEECRGQARDRDAQDLSMRFYLRYGRANEDRRMRLRAQLRATEAGQLGSFRSPLRSF